MDDIIEKYALQHYAHIPTDRKPFDYQLLKYCNNNVSEGLNVLFDIFTLYYDFDHKDSRNNCINSYPRHNKTSFYTTAAHEFTHVINRLFAEKSNSDQKSLNNFNGNAARLFTHMIFKMNIDNHPGYAPYLDDKNYVPTEEENNNYNIINNVLKSTMTSL